MRHAIMLLCVAISANAAWYLDGAISDVRPAFIERDGRYTVNPTDQQLVAAGGQELAGAAALWVVDGGTPRLKTQAELDAEAANAQQAERLRHITTAAALLEQTAPLMADHPATNDVQASGMFYRIAETGGVVTLWYARQTDLLATQLSAHNVAGEEITRTVNLRTGEDTTINIRKITMATRLSDLRDAKQTRTNRVVRIP